MMPGRCQIFLKAADNRSELGRGSSGLIGLFPWFSLESDLNFFVMKMEFNG